MARQKPEDRALLPNNGIDIKTHRDPKPEVLTTVGRLPALGDRKTFVPASFEGEHQQGLTAIRPNAENRVTGTVVYVNEVHRWYRVRFELPGGVPAFECFKY